MGGKRKKDIHNLLLECILREKVFLLTSVRYGGAPLNLLTPLNNLLTPLNNLLTYLKAINPFAVGYGGAPLNDDGGWRR